VIRVNVRVHKKSDRRRRERLQRRDNAIGDSRGLGVNQENPLRPHKGGRSSALAVDAIDIAAK
jgi:hypothetical protein